MALVGLGVFAFFGTATILPLAVPLPPPAATIPVHFEIRHVEVENEFVDVFTVSDGTDCWLVVGRAPGLAMSKARPELCDHVANGGH